ncbi:MAG: hypothetical protein RL701_7240 [Pseudomonadota bacterium]|jgi:uncharacterized Zn finger protein
MAYYDYPAYVPVAKRLANGKKKLEQLAKKRGRPLAPVAVERKHKLIANSFWGKAWCEQLALHSDYASRLPRGRTYVRNGSVLDLHISRGKVEAYVAGSELYTVTIQLTQLAAPRWKKIIAACAGRIGSLIGLLRGELSDDVLAVVTDPVAGLFPAPSEIKLRCSCPDAAYMCKHVAAVLYGVGARLDQAPELFFVLRQVDQAELVAGVNAGEVLATVGATKATSGKKRIASGAVAAVFGIELDDAPPVAKKSARKQASVPSKAVASKKKSGRKRAAAARSGAPRRERG